MSGHRDFGLVEKDLDDAIRIVDVHGTIDAVRVASVLEAVAAAAELGVVLDLSKAAIARPDDLRALAGGLLRVRCGAPVVLVSPDPTLAVLIETLGVADYIEVVPSQVMARATLIVDRTLDAPPRKPPPVPAPLPRYVAVRLDGLDGVARVRVRDAQGGLVLEGTAAGWERRDGHLTLVVRAGDGERAAFGADAVREVVRWMGDDGTLGASIVVG